MWEEMRRFVQARLDALSTADDDTGPERRSAVQGVAEQISALAAGFLQWSAEARQSMVTEIRSIVTSQMDDLGLATKREVEELRSRVERLESGGAGAASRRPRTPGTKAGGPARRSTAQAKKSGTQSRKSARPAASAGSAAAKRTRTPSSRRGRSSGTGTA